MATQRVYPVEVPMSPQYSGTLIFRPFSIRVWQDWRDVINKAAENEDGIPILKEAGYDPQVQLMWVTFWAVLECLELWDVYEEVDGEKVRVPMPPVGNLPRDEEGNEVEMDYALFQFVRTTGEEHLLPFINFAPKA